MPTSCVVHPTTTLVFTSFACQCVHPFVVYFLSSVCSKVIRCLFVHRSTSYVEETCVSPSSSKLSMSLDSSSADKLRAINQRNQFTTTQRNVLVTSISEEKTNISQSELGESSSDQSEGSVFKTSHSLKSQSLSAVQDAVNSATVASPVIIANKDVRTSYTDTASHTITTNKDATLPSRDTVILASKMSPATAQSTTTKPGTYEFMTESGSVRNVVKLQLGSKSSHGNASPFATPIKSHDKTSSLVGSVSHDTTARVGIGVQPARDNSAERNTVSARKNTTVTSRTVLTTNDAKERSSPTRAEQTSDRGRLSDRWEQRAKLQTTQPNKPGAEKWRSPTAKVESPEVVDEKSPRFKAELRPTGVKTEIRSTAMTPESRSPAVKTECSASGVKTESRSAAGGKVASLMKRFAGGETKSGTSPR